MSVLIKDMEMPKKCGECDIYVRYRTWNGDPGDEFCGLTKEGVNYKTKPEWCPLSEVLERKTGKWMIRETAYDDTEAKCSECGFVILVNEPGNGLHMLSDLRFCPNCGARMEV